MHFKYFIDLTTLRWLLQSFEFNALTVLGPKSTLTSCFQVVLHMSSKVEDQFFNFFTEIKNCRSLILCLAGQGRKIFSEWLKDTVIEKGDVSCEACHFSIDFEILNG